MIDWQRQTNRADSGTKRKKDLRKQVMCHHKKQTKWQTWTQKYMETKRKTMTGGEMNRTGKAKQKKDHENQWNR